jgi:hypothetical protein
LSSFIVLNPFVVVHLYFAVLLRNSISAAVILTLSCSFSVQVSVPFSRVAIARVLYICNPVCFYTSEGFRTWLMIPVICKNYDSLIATYFSFSCDSIASNSVFICSFVLLLIVIF